MKLTAKASLTFNPNRILATETLQFVMKRLEADSQDFRGPSLVVLQGGERGENQTLLSLFHGRADRKTAFHPGLHRCAESKVRGKMIEGDQPLFACDDRPLDDISKFSYIARPRMSHQEL